MRRSLARAGVLIVAILALIGVPVMSSTSSSSARASGSLERLVQASSLLGRTDGRTTVSTVISLRDPTREAQERTAEALYDPASPTFGGFLSPSEFASRYGPDRARVESLAGTLRERGLRVTWRTGDPWLVVDGDAATFESVFRVEIDDFRSRSGTAFYAATTDPITPVAWSDIVSDVAPITDYARTRTFVVPAGGMTPDDVVLAYDMKPLRDRGFDGTGETVVVTVGGDGYRQEDLDAFTTRYGLPPIVIDATPTMDDPLKIPLAGELEMDLEVIHAIAPGARLVVYATESRKWTRALEMVGQAVAENPNAIISQSWGSCDRGLSPATLDSLESTFRKAADTGTSVFTSTGDVGAFECMTLNDDWGSPPSEDRIGVPAPASVPWMTGVGGTRISVRADGTYYNETVWEGPASNEGGGGGASAYYPRPSWQVGPGVPVAETGAKRLVPDVAADAESGMAIYVDGAWSTGGGTSQSAPIWAGVTALMNQYLKAQGLKGVGFINPALYAIAAEPQAYPPFHDIVIGTNLVYPATPGYDMASGLGSPDVWNLARDLEAYARSGRAP